MIDQYFERIGYIGGCEPTLENLRAIQAAHAFSIPFETFDIPMGRPIVLQNERIFAKLVQERRGGYCYELNGLLHYVLQSLGFDCSLAVARLFYDGQRLSAESVHMVIIVELEQRWLVDVGWGCGFVEPFCFTDQRIISDAAGYTLCHKEQKLYQFNLEKYPLEYFQARNDYHQRSSASPFAQEIHCSLPIPEGGCRMIKGGEYMQKKEKQKITSDEEYRAFLQKGFGLDLSVNRPVQIEGEGCVLHTARNRSDWKRYHQIRYEQIHQRYCPEWTYCPDDPEEKDLNNFPLIFRKMGHDQVLGTIRIDLLPKNEASFRWIAIDAPSVHQGYGSIMLRLAERFVQERARSVIRIPATHESLPFAHHMGYKEEPWDLMPNEACMIAVSKHLLME